MEVDRKGEQYEEVYDDLFFFQTGSGPDKGKQGHLDRAGVEIGGGPGRAGGAWKGECMEAGLGAPPMSRI